MATSNAFHLPPGQVRLYGEDGYLVVPSLFTEEECQQILDRAAELHLRKNIPGCFQAVSESDAGGDPLKVFPRMMHPHRFDPLCLHFLKHPRVVDVLEQLLGGPAIGCQTMIYWKPPGAKGQAFHQDDFYLRTRPGSCIAAWAALEPMDEENGCLSIFPGSHRESILEMKPTDTSQSFTAHAVIPPPQYQQMPVSMKAGEVLFFHGQLIHGSMPNRSPSRFRRSFICHYIPASSEHFNEAYKPLIVLR